MPKLAANLTWLFTELPLRERFGAAAACGFRAVEVLFPYELPAAVVREELDAHGLDLVLVNLPAGEERGFAGLPGREAEFDAALHAALAYAEVCGCARVHAMAGRVPEGVARDDAQRTYVANLRYAAQVAAPRGVTVTIEPLNAIDNPGYLLRTTTEALATIGTVGEANLALQLDLYHTQVSEGNLERRIRTLRGRYAHVQIAGLPSRNEPDAGEVDYDYLLGVLDEVGYDGWVGCEYRPRGETRAGLGWAERYLRT
jgi:hydroxypyruvate isomerase